MILSTKFFCLSAMKFFLLRFDRFTYFLYTSSVIISLEFVSPDLSVTVGEDLLALSVQKSPSLCVFSVEFLTSFLTTGCHFAIYRTRTTTTDQQTSLLAGSDRLVLGVHWRASHRLRHRRNPRPRGTVARGAVARSRTLWGTRRKSQWRSSPWAHNLSWRRTPQLTPSPRRSSTGGSYFLTSGKLKGSRNCLRLTRNERRKMKVMRSRKLEETLSSWMRWDKHSDTLSHAMCAWNECDRRNRTRTE